MRFIGTIAAGILFIVLVYAHAGPVNGPSYFRWPWYRTSDNAKTAALLCIAASPALVAQAVRNRRLAIALIAITPALLQFTGNDLWPLPPRGMQRAKAIIVHPMASSYFTLAARIDERSDWLRDYDTIIRHAPMHAATKPPGAVAFYVALIHLFGQSRAPLVAAWLILTFGCAAVLATYASFRAIAGPEVALYGATILALVPSMTVMYPEMDWLYAAFSVAAIGLWHVALRDGSMRVAVAFGLVVFLMTLFTYSLLVLGATCLLMTIGRFRVRQVACAIATITVAYIALWAVTGFNPIRTFRAAYEMQKAIINLMNPLWAATGQARVYPRTILGDLQDFAFGMGWMPIVIALIWSAAARRRLRDNETATAIAGLVTPMIVALTGLLAAETARVWIFLMPLLILPAALELSKWKPADRVITYVVMIGCTVAVYSNAAFIII